MAGYATEQSSVVTGSSVTGQIADVEMAANATEPGLERLLIRSNVSVANATDSGNSIMVQWPRQLEIHVEFGNAMWWAMPPALSDGILEQWLSGAQQVSFIWDWQNARRGSYQPNGAETSINRYIIDFAIMCQRNIDNDRTRRIKIVCILAGGSATEQTTNQ